jgi:hypothetical protein
MRSRRSIGSVGSGSRPWRRSAAYAAVSIPSLSATAGDACPDRKMSASESDPDAALFSGGMSVRCCSGSVGLGANIMPLSWLRSVIRGPWVGALASPAIDDDALRGGRAGSLPRRGQPLSLPRRGGECARLRSGLRRSLYSSHDGRTLRRSIGAAL